MCYSSHPDFQSLRQVALQSLATALGHFFRLALATSRVMPLLNILLAAEVLRFHSCTFLLKNTLLPCLVLTRMSVD